MFDHSNGTAHMFIANACKIFLSDGERYVLRSSACSVEEKMKRLFVAQAGTVIPG